MEYFHFISRNFAASRCGYNMLSRCGGSLIHSRSPCQIPKPYVSTEMKTSRSSLSRGVAIPHHFHAFFSFPQNKGGYSGVAIYTDSRIITPLRAEEGLSGFLQPKPPLTLDERISRSYPCAHEIELIPDVQGRTPSDLIALDAEGRALIVDFGLFVLINVYCPNETSDARLPYKMNFHLMLQERVRQLTNEGREVIVVGDINICATPLDHCDGHLASNVTNFHDHPARAWFHRWLSPIGCMTDAVRTFWPDRKGMYTCKTQVTPITSRYSYPFCVRLEHENFSTGGQLRNPSRLYPRHTRYAALDQAWRHSAVPQRF